MSGERRQSGEGFVASPFGAVVRPVPLRWSLAVVAVVVRVAIALGTRHHTSDMDYWLSMRKAYLEYGFAAYSHFPTYIRHPGWDFPYPPGLIPWTIASIWVGDRLAIPRDVSLKLPFILADACLLLVVIAALERARASRRLVVIAAWLVVLGPTFLIVSAYHGQFDSLAIAPAAIAVLLWEQPGVPARALVCGALIGVGAATKTVPGFAVLALLPTVRSWREGLTLAVVTVAIPVVAILPFFLAEPQTVMRVFRYGGLPGLGGWSVIVQPSLVRMWLLGENVSLEPASMLLFAYGSRVTLAALAVVGMLLLWRRAPAMGASCAVWLTVYACAANFFASYANWGLPFLLMAGRIGAVALLTALLLPIALISFVRPELPVMIVPTYQVLAIALQAVFVGLWIRELTRLWRVTPGENRPGRVGSSAAASEIAVGSRGPHPPW